VKQRVRAAGSRPAQNAHDSAMVEDSRRQQQRGELAGDLDPAYVLLMLFAAALAPALIPQIVRITGKSADSPEFLLAYTDQLRHTIEHLEGGWRVE
jgi:TetR/AcrR family transcriptional regulator